MWGALLKTDPKGEVLLSTNMIQNTKEGFEIEEAKMPRWTVI
jgi:hypothetical protein